MMGCTFKISKWDNFKKKFVLKKTNTTNVLINVTTDGFFILNEKNEELSTTLFGNLQDRCPRLKNHAGLGDDSL
jgi:hypothetical protein